MINILMLVNCTLNVNCNCVDWTQPCWGHCAVAQGDWDLLDKYTALREDKKVGGVLLPPIGCIGFSKYCSLLFHLTHNSSEIVSVACFPSPLAEILLLPNV